jgi:hypothetical protein
MWINIDENCANWWNFLYCIWCIDGKTLKRNALPDGGSEFYDYNQLFSVLLHAAVDSSCELSTVDIEAMGCQRDARISSSLYRLLQRIDPNIPRDLALPGTISKMSFLLLGDEENPLFPYLMTLHPGRNLDDRKHGFSYRLSRAGRCVEFAYEIICAK